jgi:hypothetical protein
MQRGEPERAESELAIRCHARTLLPTRGDQRHCHSFCHNADFAGAIRVAINFNRLSQLGYMALEYFVDDRYDKVTEVFRMKTNRTMLHARSGHRENCIRLRGNHGVSTRQAKSRVPCYVSSTPESASPIRFGRAPW